MSVLENILSPEVTNDRSFGTSTAGANQSRVAGGDLMVSVGVVAIAALSLGSAQALPFVAANNSTYVLVPGIPSGVRVCHATAAWTAATAMTLDIGVFAAGTNIPVRGALSLAAAGLVMLGNIGMPQSCIAASLLLTTAVNIWTGVLGFGNAGVLAAYADRALWELAGFAKDPNEIWDIGAVCTTTSTGAAASFAFQFEFVR